MSNKIHSVRITSSNSTITNSNSEYTYDLANDVDFTNKSVALSQAIIYNSWTNITADNNQFTILWPEGGVETPYAVTIPVGTYTYAELNSYIEFFLVANSLFLISDGGINQYYLQLAVNHSFYSITMTYLAIPTSLPVGFSEPSGGFTYPTSAQTPRITLPANTTDTVGNDVGFAVVIGHVDNATYPSATKAVDTDVDGTLIPQIALVTSINVKCNLVDTSDFSSENVLKTFVPQASSGSLEIVEPAVPLYFPCIGRRFSNVNLTLTDQDERVLNVLDTAGIVFSLLVRND